MFDTTTSRPVAPAPPQSPSRSSKGTVLVVDDEPVLARVYARTLGAEGYSVLTAADGETAEQMFRSGSFDAVVSDVSMPGMGGLELLRALRLIDGDVPVIMATGDHADEKAQQAVDAGALMYLVKPLDLRALTQIVAHATMTRRHARVESALRPSGLAKEHAAKLGARFDAALAKLWMAYQPIVCWATLGVMGYEALVRSDEPTLADPGALFAAAAELGRTIELGRAIRAAVAAGIPRAPKDAWMFVNLSAAELADDTLYEAEDPLRPYAHRVVLEITERDPLEHIPNLAERMERLRAAGFGIAVDDLGAGYAGLASLVQLKPTVVKLDISLVRGIDESPIKRKIVQAMATLCNDTGVKMIGEGVETEQERMTLGFLGCRYQQGYAYAKPQRTFAASHA